jgi:hypothetical protein
LLKQNHGVTEGECGVARHRTRQNTEYEIEASGWDIETSEEEREARQAARVDEGENE